MHGRSMRGLMVLLAAFAAAGSVVAAEEAAEHDGGHEAAGVNWQEWKAGNEITSTESLQRGAANFVHYCLGCHSLKYMRWSRMADDLHISNELLQKSLLPDGA